MALVRGNLQRLFSIILAIFELFAFSGFPFGFNAFLKVYKDAGVYANLCPPESIKNETKYFSLSTNNNNNNNKTIPINNYCPPQDDMFAHAFMLWLISPAIITLPLGMVLDRLGFRTGKLVAAICFFLSTFCFAFTTKETPFFLFPAGVLGMTSAYALIMINTQAARLYPKITSVLISFCSGSFDSSSLVFTIFASLLNWNIFSSYKAMILCYGIIGTCILLFSAVFIFPENPDEVFQIIRETHVGSSVLEIHKSFEEKVNNVKQDGNEISIQMKTPKTDASQPLDVESQLKYLYPTLLTCFKSRFFIFTNLYFGILFLRLNYFLTGLGYHMKNKFPTDDIHYLNVSSYFLFCGLFFAPLAGFCIDFLRAFYAGQETTNTTTTTTTTMDKMNRLQIWYGKHLRPLFAGTLICSLLGLLLTFLNFSSQPSAAYVSFLCFTLFRVFLFCSIYACLIMAFPANHFGLVYGLITLCAGVLSLLQYLLLWASKLYGFEVITWILVIVMIVPFMQPIQILLYRRKNV